MKKKTGPLSSRFIFRNECVCPKKENPSARPAACRRRTPYPLIRVAPDYLSKVTDRFQEQNCPRLSQVAELNDAESLV
jgi:hypothetical protein